MFELISDRYMHPARTRCRMDRDTDDYLCNCSVHCKMTDTSTFFTDLTYCSTAVDLTNTRNHQHLIRNAHSPCSATSIAKPPTLTQRPFRHPPHSPPPPKHYDFSSLFLFSLLFSLSTRFTCIFSAIFSYRAFSSLAALRSLIVLMRRYQPAKKATNRQNFNSRPGG